MLKAEGKSREITIFQSGVSAQLAIVLSVPQTSVILGHVVNHRIAQSTLLVPHIKQQLRTGQTRGRARDSSI